MSFRFTRVGTDDMAFVLAELRLTAAGLRHANISQAELLEDSLGLPRDTERTAELIFYQDTRVGYGIVDNESGSTTEFWIRERMKTRDGFDVVARRYGLTEQ